MQKRIDTKSRVISIEGEWMGLDFGGIMFGEEIIAELKYPVHTVIDCDTEVLAASWFQLHKANKDGDNLVRGNSGDG